MSREDVKRYLNGLLVQLEVNENINKEIKQKSNKTTSFYCVGSK